MSRGRERLRKPSRLEWLGHIEARGRDGDSIRSWLDSWLVLRRDVHPYGKREMENLMANSKENQIARSRERLARSIDLLAMMMRGGKNFEFVSRRELADLKLWGRGGSKLPKEKP